MSCSVRRKSSTKNERLKAFGVTDFLRNIVATVRKDFTLCRDPYRVPRDMIEDKLNHLSI